MGVSVIIAVRGNVTTVQVENIGAGTALGLELNIRVGVQVQIAAVYVHGAVGEIPLTDDQPALGRGGDVESTARHVQSTLGGSISGKSQAERHLLKTG